MRHPGGKLNWKATGLGNGIGRHSSGAEHFLGKEEVPGSNPGVGSRNAGPRVAGDGLNGVGGSKLATAFVI